MKFTSFLPTGLACIFLSLASAPLFAADPAKERELIGTLKSDAEKGEKAIACKKLAIYGSAEAVPALAPLLADADLASWARIALEAIPGPAADEALRQAVPKLQGRLLVGTINSIGVRRDGKAVTTLTAKLADTDADVVAASAVALGRIGGNAAAKALKGALTKSSEAARGGVAEGCIRCAEQFLAQGTSSAAVALYDSVRKANVPKQKLLDATRGAILARGNKGIPLLVEQIRSSDKALVAIGLSAARELPGSKATEALIAELRRSAPEKQPLLLLALADRGDAAVKPTILECATSGSKPLRLAAVGLLDRTGDESCISALESTATSSDAELSQAAKTALTRLPGAGVDSRLVNDLAQATGKTKCALIEVAGRRGLDPALPAIMRSVDDSDPEVRAAGLQALGAIGQSKQLPDLVRLVGKARTSQDRTALEEALLAICARAGSTCVPEVQSLARSSDSAVRLIALRLLAASGGSEALAALKSATADQDQAVQDEAVRTLSSWPNTWPEDEAVMEPLLSVAKSSTKTSHQVLALRGYLQFLQGDKKLNREEKITKLKEVMPLLQRPEEKRLAIAVIGSAPSKASLELLVKMAQDQTIAEDAASAAIDMASKNRSGISNEDRREALQRLSEKAANDDLRKRAEEAVKKL